MQVLFGPLIAWIARVIVPLFGASRLWTVFRKLISGGLFTVGLPLAINYGIFSVAQHFSGSIFSTLGLEPRTIQLVSVGAWIADQIQLDAAFSIFLGFVAQAGAIKFARYSGLFGKFSTDLYS